MNVVDEGAGRPASDSSALADLIDRLTARMQAGEVIDWEEEARRHPECAGELLQLRPALGALGDLSRSGPEELSGVAPPAGPAVGAWSPPAVGAWSPDHAPTASGLLGEFRIIREVGRGGMGVVYEAEQTSLGRRVALKVLPFAATIDPRHLQRFQNEARAAACLHHGHIVPVYSVGCERGVYFYAMQFIDGQPLAELIRELRRRTGPAAGLAPAVADPDVPTTAHVPSHEVTDPKADTEAAGRQSMLATLGPVRGREYFRRVAELGVQAAEALDHAHQMGIVHRDVKPGNLLLDGRGSVWVADFGLAHFQHSDASLTMTGDLVGTLRYMSPEQALGKRAPIDHRTDVYSLGATLYELLTLRPAFEGKDRQEVLRQIAFEEPKPPRRIAKGVPAELEVIVLKAMGKNPAERYGTAQETADDLRRWLDYRPIRARRPSWRKVAARRMWRHRAVVWAAAVVAVFATLFAGGIGVVWMQQRAVLEAQVGEALHQAAGYQEQGKLQEALAAIRQAEAMVNAGPADVGLRDRVRQRRTELEMAATFEDIRLTDAPVRNNGVSVAGPMKHPLYAQAFMEHGIHVLSVDPEEVGARIRATGVAVELTAALDDWAWAIRKNPELRGDLAWKHVLEAARAADPDDWRNRVRGALMSEPPDLPTLEGLACSAGAADQPPATQVLLGIALRESGAVEEAKALLRTAQQRHPGDFWINEELATTFGDPRCRQWDEELRFATAASVLRPEMKIGYFRLARALVHKGAVDEAFIAYKQSRPDTPVLFPATDQSGACYSPATPESGAIHDFGCLLDFEGRQDDAIAAFRKAIQIKPDFEPEHTYLASFLESKWLLDDAIAEYREAIKLKKDFGLSDRLSNALDLAEREALLPAILRGEAAPADAGQRVRFADFCRRYKRLNASASGFYADAFAAEPGLAIDLQSSARYNAACAAALAGCGQGKDAGSLDEKESVRLRRQALEWLRADLAAWKPQLSSTVPPEDRLAVLLLARWRWDEDLAGVRDADALMKLPDAERAAWRQLWADLDALLPKANH